MITKMPHLSACLLPSVLFWDVPIAVFGISATGDACPNTSPANEGDAIYQRGNNFNEMKNILAIK